jgi:hypothetical protein
MKSPAELALRWAKQWEVTDTREQRLLNARSWPVSLPIGKPSTAEFTQRTRDVREHLKRWRAVGVGRVLWEPVTYRGGNEPVDVPVQWVLDSPSEWSAACDEPAVRKEFERLGRLVAAADPVLHRTLVRQRYLLQDKPEAELVQAIELARVLHPGCAAGRPLRTLGACGIDSKFFERHRALIVQLLDARFDGQVSELGLEAFLEALDESEHWLLVAALAPGLLPFVQQRVRAREIATQPLPGSHLVIVENERCLYQLPPLPDTVVVLGAGLNLEWLHAAWLQERRIAYWGDLDTWGLLMLSRARERQPHLESILMSRELFDALAPTSAVVEGNPAGEQRPGVLSDPEWELYLYLRRLEKGRLEQEMIPRERVMTEFMKWRSGG